MPWRPPYASTAELKSYLRIGDADDDPELDFAIEAASRAIDNHTNRQFGKAAAAEERFYTAHRVGSRGRWVIMIDDLMSVAGLVLEVQDVDGVALGVIDLYDLEPRNAAPEGRPWTAVMVRPTSAAHPTGRQDEVAITAAAWGWTAVPTVVKQACLLQASRVFARRDSPYGIAGSPDQGSELRLLAKLDPDVAVSLRSVVRWWAGA